MTSLLYLILPVFLGPWAVESVVNQYIPNGAPPPPPQPIKMAYQPLIMQPQTLSPPNPPPPHTYQPPQTYYPPSQPLSTFSYPAPNPMLVFRHAMDYHSEAEPIPKGRRKPLLPEGPEAEGLELPAASSVNIVDPHLQVQAPSNINTNINMSTPSQNNVKFSHQPEPGYNDHVDAQDPDSYPIPVKMFRNGGGPGPSYPMHLVMPILPQLQPVLNPGYSFLMMPVQLFHFDPVVPGPMMRNPAPEIDRVDFAENEESTFEPSTNQEPEITSELPQKVTEAPVTEEEPPVTAADLVIEATSTSTTPVPESYSSIDYASLPAYFNAIYSREDVTSYAAGYSNYIRISKFLSNSTADGYRIEFETENGIKSLEEGHLKQMDLGNSNGANHPDGISTPGVVHVKSGQVIWTSPECITYTLKYIADENGYNPTITESQNNECLMVYGSSSNEILDSAPPAPQ